MAIIVNPNRVRLLKDGKAKRGTVVYWMSRDQRASDNWALFYALKRAKDQKVPLYVVFCLVPTFLDAAYRHYQFMIEGLKETAGDLGEKNIPFYIFPGEPEKVIPEFLKNVDASLLVTDFDPLRIKQVWKRQIISKIGIPFYEVDARNIVPCWKASNKQEYGAYTMRPKISKIIHEYLQAYPILKQYKFGAKEKITSIDWSKLMLSLGVDKKAILTDWLKPGSKAALKNLKHFIKDKLEDYDVLRNDPSVDAQSHLSPYLHFGQISSLTIYDAVSRSNASKDAKAAFLEELVVRRELSDNFCFYNQNYDNFNGLPNWARETLIKHKKDKREHVYTIEELENSKTHDDLWNAAQTEMVVKGKMHGYMRMYWAKKILEWSPSPKGAMRIAIYLNDKYELDGRDTNGYTGIMWSIGGLHDRAWGERRVFGKIRYMSYKSQIKKFNYKSYIDKMNQLIS